MWLDRVPNQDTEFEGPLALFYDVILNIGEFSEG